MTLLSGINNPDNILRYLSRQYPNRLNITISEPVPLGSGWESEIIGFHAAWQEEGISGGLPIALRLYNGQGAIEKATHEYQSLANLHKAGYPVPAVYALHVDPSTLGKPFIIMEMIDGKAMWGLLDQSSPEEASQLLDQLNDLLIKLHSLDWRRFQVDFDPALENNPYWFIDRWLNMGGVALAGSGLEDFKPVLRWLELRRNLLGCQRPAAVHGDFHPNNVLIKADGSAVVIDWTNFQVADPRYDLAWTLLLARVYAGENVRHMILDRYVQSPGTQIDSLDIFEVIACTRRLYDIYNSLSNGADQMGMRPEITRIMQEQLWAVRIVYDLLLSHTGVRIQAVEKLLS